MKSSLHVKIYISFFFVALIPFYSLLYYTYTQSHDELNQKVKEHYKKKLEHISLHIQKDITTLKDEIDFISTLTIMNDVIKADEDKRLQSLIELKTRVFKLKTAIDIYDINANLIASASTCDDKQERGLLFHNSLYASFNHKRAIGYIQTLLPFSSLSYYFNDMETPWCIKQNGATVLRNCYKKDSLKISKNIGIENLEIVLLLDKDEIVKPLGLLKQQLLILAFFSFILIVILLLIVSKLVSKPLTQIAQFQQTQLQLLEESKHSHETQKHLITNLQHYINTKSEPSKLLEAIEHSKEAYTHLEFHEEKINLQELLDEVIELLAPQAKYKSLYLVSTCNKNIIFYSDKNMLKNILINLIENAIEFTQEGGVRLDVEISRNLKISVRDSGVGITKEQTKELFKPLENIKRNELGLALSKAYAEALDARLYAIYHENGSEFVIEYVLNT